MSAPAIAAGEEAVVLQVGDLVDTGVCRIRVTAVDTVDGVPMITAAELHAVDVSRLTDAALRDRIVGLVERQETIPVELIGTVLGMERPPSGRHWRTANAKIVRAVEGAVVPSDKDEPLPPLPASSEPTDGDLTRAVRAWDTAMPGEAGMLEAEVEE